MKKYVLRYNPILNGRCALFSISENTDPDEKEATVCSTDLIREFGSLEEAELTFAIMNLKITKKRIIAPFYSDDIRYTNVEEWVLHEDT